MPTKRSDESHRRDGGSRSQEHEDGEGRTEDRTDGRIEEERVNRERVLHPRKSEKGA